MNPECIESSIAGGFIEAVSTGEDLTDEILRLHLENMAIESTESMSIEVLDDLGEQETQYGYVRRVLYSVYEIPIYCVPQTATPPEFVQGNKGCTESHRTACTAGDQTDVLEKLFDLRSQPLQAKVERDFSGFVTLAMKLSEAFKLSDIRPKAKPNPNLQQKTKVGHSLIGGNNINRTVREGKFKFEANKDSAPLWPFLSCKKEGRCHWIADLDRLYDEQKNTKKAEPRAVKALGGTAYNTHSRAGRSTQGSGMARGKKAGIQDGLDLLKNTHPHV